MATHVNPSIRIWLFLILLAFSATNFAQQSISGTSVEGLYADALKLFSSRSYKAAQNKFEKVAKLSSDKMQLKTEADYHIAMCAIRLNQVGADQMVLDFVRKHPSSNKKNQAYFNVGNYYFSNKKAAHSLKWFTKVDVSLLPQSTRDEINFKMGYALLTTKNYKQAQDKFIKLVNDPKYGNDSRYYYGYIAYKQEDYTVAEKTLEEISDDQAYESEVSYYLLDINFKAGRFQKTIDMGLALIDKAKPREKSEISKIIGESYFNLMKYNEAIPYLTAYKGKRGKWNNTDYYQLGFAYYQQNDYENAMRYFNKILGIKNHVSQNAYYNLGQCYLKLEKKSEALNAFKSASEMHFDERVREDAFLNYAKLSYEVGNPYKDVAVVLQEFLEKYPDSKHFSEINELIVTSYLHQQNYEGALTYLNKNKKGNTEFINEVSLYRGLQLYLENKLEEALVFFIRGVLSNQNTIKFRSLYWKGETLYQLEKYSEAVSSLHKAKQLGELNGVEESILVNYALGYAYFKQNDYENAKQSFQTFLSKINEDSSLKDDTVIRIADSYYSLKMYNDAISTYRKITENYGAGADYAQYQIGMSFGFLKQHEEKTKQLELVLTNFERSNYKDDALFQLGTTYAILNNNDKAHAAYRKLFREFPRSSFYSKAMLRNALLYYNDNLTQEAIDTYKRIVSKFPNTTEAKEAISNAKNVYVDIGKVDEYAAWVKTISYANISDSELDNSMYQSAENKFLEGENSKAIEGFRKYLATFSQKGNHTLKANYYLGQLLEKNNNIDQAKVHYIYVANQPQNEFSEDVLNKLSQIYLEADNWDAAMPLLQRLEKESQFPQNILFAQSNLMKGFYQKEDFENAVIYAERILENDKLDPKVQHDANIIIARSAFKQEDFEKAEEYYLIVERNSQGELKAEALYYNAFFKNENKDYEGSNQVIQDIAANYSIYKYWGAKSFIIMAKNYYALEDSDPYQATYILDNIIQNFSQFEDLIAEAKQELKRIQQNESKTNNSVTPQN